MSKERIASLMHANKTLSDALMSESANLKLAIGVMLNIRAMADTSGDKAIFDEANDFLSKLGRGVAK